MKDLFIELLNELDEMATDQINKFKIKDLVTKYRTSLISAEVDEVFRVYIRQADANYSISLESGDAYVKDFHLVSFINFIAKFYYDDAVLKYLDDNSKYLTTIIDILDSKFKYIKSKYVKNAEAEILSYKDWCAENKQVENSAVSLKAYIQYKEGLK